MSPCTYARRGENRYVVQVARSGRPKGGDSAETRRRIICVARREFAAAGYDGSSVAAIAAAADLATSAVYHYFGSKQVLYEAVFDASIEDLWTKIDRAATSLGSLVDAVQAIVIGTRRLSETDPDFNAFLALVPVESKLHDEFADLTSQRSAHQDETFGALARLGIETGELTGFTQSEATEMLRALIMGWFLERQMRGSEIPGSGESLVTLIRLLGERSQS